MFVVVFSSKTLDIINPHSQIQYTTTRYKKKKAWYSTLVDYIALRQQTDYWGGVNLLTERLTGGPKLCKRRVKYFLSIKEGGRRQNFSWSQTQPQS